MKKYLIYPVSILFFLISAFVVPAQATTVLDKYNPLFIEGSEQAQEFRRPAGIVTRALQFAIPVAGLILFVMLVWGGFEMVTSSISAKKDAGKQRITTALTGFFLLFASFWLAQLVEVIFSVNII